MMAQIRHRTVPGRVAFHPGSPEIAAFPFPIWSRLLARQARRAEADLFGYHYIGGHPTLRAAIANHVSVARGVECDPDQVVVLTGAQGALDLMSRLLVDPGDKVWIEEPGYRGAYSAFLAAGATVEPLRVTTEGWDIEACNRPGPRLAFVTPSCQFPLGRVMLMGERLKLLALARKHGFWIIEDDYDSEYRFRGPPIPALHSLDDAGRVVYMGTFAKTLFPTLRIGFVVIPHALVDGMKRALSHTGQYPPLMIQATLADFINQGHFATHIRHMRRLYASRRKLFIDLARKQLSPWIEIEENDTGMQLVGSLDQRIDDTLLAANALAAGIDIAPLSGHYNHPPSRNGIIFGYAGVGEAEMHSALSALRLVLQDVVACL